MGEGNPRAQWGLDSLNQMRRSSNLSLKALVPWNNKSSWNSINASWRGRLNRSAWAFILGHSGYVSQRTAPSSSMIWVNSATCCCHCPKVRAGA